LIVIASKRLDFAMLSCGLSFNKWIKFYYSTILPIALLKPSRDTHTIVLFTIRRALLRWIYSLCSLLWPYGKLTATKQVTGASSGYTCRTTWIQTIR